MKISLIVAKSRNNVIGNNNQLPWHLPADLKHFKTITMGKPIIMGRKTFDSIGKPLPGRRNIIISRQQNFYIDGCEIFHSINDALSAVKTEKEVMIIGGTNLFLQVLPIAERIYLTVIDADFEGDAFFPQLDYAQWLLISEEKWLSDEKNKYPYCFQTLDKR
ncbi:MAG: type 3 dihydrofolate reductase [Gammaproteobacteria bacterium]|nr:type 3 dihydrofolate reductase [Gammaproteobacteria bacterium]